MDVYVVSAEGGVPRAVTVNSVNETPVLFIAYSAHILRQGYRVRRRMSNTTVPCQMTKGSARDGGRDEGYTIPVRTVSAAI